VEAAEWRTLRRVPFPAGPGRFRRPILRPLAPATIAAACAIVLAAMVAPLPAAARPTIGDAAADVALAIIDPAVATGGQARPGGAAVDPARDGLASRRAAEQAIPVAHPIPPALDTLEGYRWPIAHPRLTLPFGPSPWGSRLVDGQSFHDGIDLATFCGDPITAAHAGTVLAAGRRYDRFMGWVGDLGPYLERLDRRGLWSTLPIVVVIDDGNGYRSIYAHFNRVVVEPGQEVGAGQLLGYEGDTGRASGCHLHYGVFSPWETATFAIRRDVVKRMKLPAEQIARVDPLLVLPPRRGIK
jgi:murein DD-endopeptidase MepM/ murein hydrolase activator NlpD